MANTICAYAYATHEFTYAYRFSVFERKLYNLSGTWVQVNKIPDRLSVFYRGGNVNIIGMLRKKKNTRYLPGSKDPIFITGGRDNRRNK